MPRWPIASANRSAGANCALTSWSGSTMSVVQSTKTEPGIWLMVVLIASADILGVLPPSAKILGLDVAANIDDRSPGWVKMLSKPFGTDQRSGKNGIGHHDSFKIIDSRYGSLPPVVVGRVDEVMTPGYHTWAESTRKWLSGRASPCQGEGRGFESRLPLQCHPGRCPGVFVYSDRDAQVCSRSRVLSCGRGGMADAAVLKTAEGQPSCGFESRRPHQKSA